MCWTRSGLRRATVAPRSHLSCRSNSIFAHRLMAQHVSSFSSSTSPSPSARWGYYIPLSLVLLFPATYFLTRSASSPHLSPQVYSDHAIASSHNLIPSHKEITIPVPASQRDLFDQSAVRRDGTPLEKGEVAVQHVMIKNPDLQIERPYTPVNDVAGDGEMGLVVKRVRGGEVGRLVHSLRPGDMVGVRGPITTFTLIPSAYDKIIMVSTGTGIAPFLQLLSKLPTPSGQPENRKAPKLHLIHSLPGDERSDWSVSPAFLPRVQQRLGERLVVERVPPGPIQQQVLQQALVEREQGARVLVLVCLPPSLMRPLCGPLRINLEQGPVTGLLRELGLTSAEVWKLE